MGPSRTALPVGFWASLRPIKFYPRPSNTNGFGIGISPGIGMLAQPAAPRIIMARQPYIRNFRSLWLKLEVSAFDPDYLSFNKGFSQGSPGLL